ncbi:MAG TPA: SLC13 family permease [Rhodanobacteraceae bacterium]
MAFRALRAVFGHLRHERLLACFALLALALALLDPRSPAAWLDWLQWPTLAGLAGLLIAIQGIGDSALVRHFAGKALTHLRTVRGLGVALVLLSALAASVLTNDVSLFLVVPLTLALDGHVELPVGRLVTLEAFAVNAGSTASPIGNPQNLLLWHHAGVGFPAFVAAMWPAAAIMLGLTLLLALIWLPGTRLAVMTAPAPRVIRGLGTLSVLALAGMVLALQYRHPLIGMLAVGAGFVLCARRSLRRVDWGLLATFAAIFLALGHLSAWPPLVQLLGHLHLQQAGPLYLTGILASQLISNVPASVLLTGHTTHTLALATAVNVGGYGCVIGSLANLIALRLARGHLTMTAFHRVSLPFLLVCAVLVYMLT